MRGTPVEELNGSLGDFLRNIEGTLTYSYEKPIRCDQCAEVIHPNQPCGLLIPNRFIGEAEDETEFRLARIECQDCRPPKIMYSAPGYTEILLTVRFDTDYTVQDVHLLDKSGQSSGIEWDPEAVQDLFDPSGNAWLDSSPFDMIRSISAYIDPRKVIDPETGEILIPDSDIEGFQLLFAYTVASRERSKDEVKALKQSVEGELSEEEIREYGKYMDSEITKLVESTFF
jgi:hypothetical protein